MPSFSMGLYHMKRTAIWMALFSGVCLLFIMLIMFVDVIGRYLFGMPLTFSVELVELLMGCVITFSLAYTTIVRGHIQVDILNQFIGQMPKKVLLILADFATMCFLLAASWQLLRKANSNMNDGSYTQILEWSVHPWLYLMSAAVFFSVLVVMHQIYKFIFR